MSLDYTDTWVASGFLSTAPGGAADTVLGYFASKSFNFKLLHVTLGFAGTPANSNTTFKLQRGNADLSAWTDVYTYAITTANTIGTLVENRITDSSTDGTKGVVYRMISSSSGANAGLLFFANVSLTSIHC